MDKFNRKSFNVNRCWNIILTFSCVNPHSQLEDPSSENFIWQSWTYSSVFFYNGRAESFPTLQLTIDSWTSDWMKFILNWYTIEISTSLTAWDVVSFDWEKKEVRVNNVEVAYTGPFTALNYWDNSFEVQNDWTYTWSLSYFTKFL